MAPCLLGLGDTEFAIDNERQRNGPKQCSQGNKRPGFETRFGCLTVFDKGAQNSGEGDAGYGPICDGHGFY